MKNPRTFEVKVRFNADEVLAFSRACSEKDIKQGKLLRDLALDWLRHHQSSELTPQRKRPDEGPNWALPVANSRWNYGTTPVRPRI
jgi:hypothetical protein